MRIWFDLTNSPHVPFFARMIRELQSANDVVVTCRELANTVGLLELEKIPYRIVGRHYGASTLMKATGFWVRALQLWRHLRRELPDVALSQSSFYSPVVARMLGIPSVYLNDNEHARGNTLSFRCATRIMVPEFLSDESLLKQRADLAKVIKYPGVKEGVYLWRFLADSIEARQRPERRTIFVRPEPVLAQYYSGGHNFIDALLIELETRFRVIILPRTSEQSSHYKAPPFQSIEVWDRSAMLDDIVVQCDLFIGAGGTMTRELAVLGIPTMSIYQDDLLDVDRFLLRTGAMVHAPHPTLGDVTALLDDRRRRGPSVELLEKGRAAYGLIRETALELGRSRCATRIRSDRQ